MCKPFYAKGARKRPAVCPPSDRDPSVQAFLAEGVHPMTLCAPNEPQSLYPSQTSGSSPIPFLGAQESDAGSTVRAHHPKGSGGLPELTEPVSLLSRMRVPRGGPLRPNPTPSSTPFALRSQCSSRSWPRGVELRPPFAPLEWPRSLCSSRFPASSANSL